MTKESILILPGIGNSGRGHWQTRWQELLPHTRRVEQQDWNHPVCGVWVAALEAAVRSSEPHVVLVAHSLACLQLTHWAASTRCRIRGALLVAVPDPEGAAFPPEAIGFSPLPLGRFAFPSIVVASSNDPYGSIDHTRRCAGAWGNRLVEIGAAGHINAGSGLGDWVQGQALLSELLSR
ncbi:RBBP9/YdeN family alpha/beta hydrolase [Variovorax fucosicus]|uniref:RBBP9/YdeN family alpha/beta hydrolase n=1 Tax=Variovorax fucosicus TaxID=3053517 RepID=UPI0025777F67|nr:alpha/beta hydrolase [Variovorax sp. J22G47]MDM0056425.1 alpha/beta hydrolase [Variovorax sp. J22G47]